MVRDWRAVVLLLVALACRREAQDGGLTRRPASGAKELSGVVVFPPGVPADESAMVVVYATLPGSDEELEELGYDEDAWQEAARAPVGADGAFRLPLPAKYGLLTVALEARYLYLTVPPEVDDVSAPLRLETAVGGALRFRFSAAGSKHRLETIVGREVELSWSFPNGWNTGSVPSRTLRVDDAKEVFAGGLPPEFEYELGGELPPFAPVGLPELRAFPGQVRVIEVPLVDGLSLHGRVLDPEGHPVAGASLQVCVDVEDGAVSRSSFVYCQSDDEGRFAFEGVDPRVTKLVAQQLGFVDADIGRERLSAASVEIVLSRGRTITGIVSLPDGRPVVGATVECRGPGRGNYAPTQQTRADDSGSFLFSGFGDDRLSLVAEARFDADPLAASGAVAQAVEERDERSPWRSEPLEVGAGTNGVRLLLRAPASITGRVIDDEGQPVTSFVLQAAPDQGSPHGRGLFFFAEHVLPVESADGSFRWDLPVGEWAVGVTADGFADSELAVEVPGGPKPLEFVLRKTTAVEGVVVDPEGGPVAGAYVQAVLLIGKGRTYDGNFSVETDEDGTFRIEELEPGQVELIAMAKGFAPSEPQALTVVRGAGNSGLVLRLTRGGMLSIEARDDRGAPIPYATIRVQGPGLEFMEPIETDAEGKLDFGPLRPGEYSVSASAGKQRFSAQAHVVDGGATRVVVGGPRQVAVVVRGSVQCLGEPVQGAMVRITDDSGEEPLSTETDASGRFELELERGGKLTFEVFGKDAGRPTSFERDVPAVGTAEFALGLPGGGLRGRLHLPEGVPVSFWTKIVVLRDSPNGASWTRDDVAKVRPLPDGSWSCSYLPPGTYRVLAAEEPAFADAPGPKLPGMAIGPEVTLGEGEWVEGIELVPGPSGAVAGRVRDSDGRALSSVVVYARAADGRLLHPDCFRLGAGGLFRIEGLPAGRVLLEAVGDGLASPMPVPVDVVEGEVREVALELGAATELVVRLEGLEEGAPGVLFSLRDERGFEYALERATAGSASTRTRERRFGPLASGTWRAEATAADGRHAEASCVLSGEREATLTLHLTDR